MKKQIVIGAMIVLTMSVLMAVAPPAGPQIYIAPADTTVFLDEPPDTFVIRVCVTGEITELMGWDIHVRFDSTIITLMDVTEGALPENSPFETFFWWFDPGVPATTAHVNGAILGNTVDGPGVLFDLVFEKTAVGSTAVELFDTEIRTGVNTSIPHTTNDGLVVVEKPIAVEEATWGEIKEKYR
ncbi:MAG: hypothetical protein JSW50_07945 [Candidatus Latescibacterota bacterium]|nr:MAG: hypothetical protein JSW50_07945 [Candidatus Latescibacterota bacterium]